MTAYGVRVFLYLLPTVLLQLPFSALIVILERVTRSLFLSHTTRDYYGSGAGGFTVSGTDLAVDDDPAPTLAFLGVSVLGVLFACLSAAGMWELRRVDGIRGAGQRAWCWGVLAMQAVVLGVSVGVLAWASALQSSQEGADLGAGKEYTRETWVCEAGKRYTEEQDWAGTACGTAVCTLPTDARDRGVVLTRSRRQRGSYSFLWPSRRFWPWLRPCLQRSRGVVRAGCFVDKATMEVSKACMKWALRDRHHSTTPMPLHNSSRCHSRINSRATRHRCMLYRRRSTSLGLTSLRPSCKRAAQLWECNPYFGSSNNQRWSRHHMVCNHARATLSSSDDEHGDPVSGLNGFYVQLDLVCSPFTVPLLSAACRTAECRTQSLDPIPQLPQNPSGCNQ